MGLRRDFIKIPLGAFLAGALSLSALPALAQQVTLLNVSYDPTRELYDALARSGGWLATPAPAAAPSPLPSAARATC